MKQGLTIYCITCIDHMGCEKCETNSNLKNHGSLGPKETMLAISRKCRIVLKFVTSYILLQMSLRNT